MLKIGLTGGLASGKSFILNLFKKEGFFTIKADEIAKELYKREGSLKAELIKKFGEEIFKDEKINKKALEEILFENREKRRIFEKLFYSYFIPFQEKLFKKYFRIHKALVYESALLFEVGTYKKFDIIILTYCSRENQIKRAVERGISREKALKILKFQIPPDKLLGRVNFLINTDTTPQKTVEQTKKIIKEIKKLF